MKKTTVYLIGGKAGSGKDTLASQIVKNQGAVRYAFADKIKDIARELFDLSDEQMYGSLKEVEDKRYLNRWDEPHIWVKNFFGKKKTKNALYKPYLTPRRILQVIGQDFRKLFEDVWNEYVFSQVEYSSAAGNSVFTIPDLRFPSEYEYAKRWEEKDPENRLIIAIKIERPGQVEIDAKNDITETAMKDFPNWDRILINDGSIEDLYTKFLSDAESGYKEQTREKAKPKCGYCRHTNDDNCSVVKGCKEKILL